MCRTAVSLLTAASYRVADKLHYAATLQVLMALGGTNLERGRKVTEHVVVGTTGKVRLANYMLLSCCTCISFCQYISVSIPMQYTKGQG
jgi:hypothetical protein